MVAKQCDGRILIDATLVESSIVYQQPMVIIIGKPRVPLLGPCKISKYHLPGACCQARMVLSCKDRSVIRTGVGEN